MQLYVTHVGGLGNGIGPASIILALGQDVDLTIIEANIGGREWGGYERRAGEYAQKAGLGSVKFVPAVVAASEQDRDFYQNGDPRSSGLFPPNEMAKDFRRKGGSSDLVWGDATVAKSVDRVRTTTLDALLAEEKIDQPDVLSMDIQGGELDAMIGAEKVLEGVTCVVAEMEFYEMYKGQGMAFDIAAVLDALGFFYVGNASQEQWYPSTCMLGRGVYAVCEAIFIKDYRLTNDFHQLIALALASNAFECHWSTLEAVGRAETLFPDRAQRFLGGVSPASQVLRKARTWIEAEMRK